MKRKPRKQEELQYHSRPPPQLFFQICTIRPTTSLRNPIYGTSQKLTPFKILSTTILTVAKNEKKNPLGSKCF